MAKKNKTPKTPTPPAAKQGGRKNKPKRSKPRKRNNMLESLPLNRNSAQVGASVQTYFRIKSTNDPRRLIICGRDLARVPLSASSATTTTVVLTTQQLSVATAPLITRWGTWGTLYQRWRIVRLRATFVSNLGVTTVGNNYMAFAESTNTPPPTTAETIMRLNGVMGSAYSNISCEFDPGAQIKFYDTVTTATDLASSQPGTFYFMTDGYSAALVPGHIVIDYELELADPE
jgi:hypothetical protein